jgi:hypothetical protein
MLVISMAAALESAEVIKLLVAISQSLVML